MKILICHHSFNSVGGGERVALHLLKLLQDLGHDVAVATSEPTDWNYVRKIIGIDVGPVKEYNLVPVRLRAFGIYQRFLTSLHVLRFREKFDIIINTHGDVMLLPVDITYLHFPVISYLKLGYLKPYFKYLKSPFWLIYFTPYYLIQNRLAHQCFSNSLVITNSNFSASIIKMIFNIDAVIIYPPVEIDQYLKLSENEDREDSVIYLARYSEEKNNHLLVLIAKELPDIKFYLAGSAHGKGRYYYEYCRKLKEKLNVKNIEILKNITHEDKLKLLSKCKVYVHLMPMEHFGIAPVEALASGLVPVAHASGGTWSDVLEYGKYGLGYKQLSVHEIAEKIKEALKKWSRSFIYSARTHVQKFSVEAFRKKFTKVIEKYGS